MFKFGKQMKNQHANQTREAPYCLQSEIAVGRQGWIPYVAEFDPYVSATAPYPPPPVLPAGSTYILLCVAMGLRRSTQL
ncbi:hypothetical protein NQZ68_009229 [Dissostichus eleginoides]|nr:hypothetical protein NQZ68_009229 [Dissostichus eleginoides]